MELTKQNIKDLKEYSKSTVYSYRTIKDGYIKLNKNFSLLELAVTRARYYVVDLRREIDIILETIKKSKK